MSTFYQNKIVLITGAASGIGLALSKELLKYGSTVYMTDINLELVRAEAKKLGPKANAIELDVVNRIDFKKVVEHILDQSERIDFLFNNAGIGYAGETFGYSFEDWDKIIDVNLKGGINGTAIIYPIMKSQGSGHIIFTASIAGLVPSAMLVPYATSKHAIVGLSRSLRLEATLYNIQVSVLCPGTIETPMLDNCTPIDMDEHLSINAREYLSSITGKPISTEKFAKKALIGISKNSELIFYPKKAKEIWRLSRFFPRVLEGLATIALNRLRKNNLQSNE